MEKKANGVEFEWLGKRLVKIKGDAVGKIFIKGCVYTGMPESRRFNIGSFLIWETNFNWDGNNQKKKNKKFCKKINIDYQKNWFSKNFYPDLRDMCLKRGSLVQHIILKILREKETRIGLDFSVLTFIFNQTVYTQNIQKNRMNIAKFILKYNNRKTREIVARNSIQGYIEQRLHISLVRNQTNPNLITYAVVPRYYRSTKIFEFYPFGFFFENGKKHIGIIMINWKIRKIKELINYSAFKVLTTEF